MAMNLPFQIVGQHRAFQVKGDSMPPVKDGATVVGRYIPSFSEIKDGETYIILTKDDGIVYKRLYRDRKKQANLFEFHSDNPVYAPYTVQAENILGIWEFVCTLQLDHQQDIRLDNVIRFLQSYHVEMML